MAAAADGNVFVPLDGGCTCGAVRYRMTAAPLFVHCCHCRWCQRETGSSFALNALIEPAQMQLLQGTVDVVLTPSASGRGQKYVRCPHCRVALWSHYAGAGDAVCFVRVGTLDTPDRLPPDLHIFTMSKQPWVVLPPGTPAVTEYYEREAYWPAASLARWPALRGKSGAASES
ncbi:putative glutathione-dependent formaldehyde-activating enzyme [Variovorax paradoxus B4]|uniref:Putative glutathione-dependent formaldehyde-activating enzyme n=1 Tax=Variovorax paradoxus B4 TaxID=1246301 RepID=T1X568_VARPD|nr:GFA family protein [Variovorax paradoxus]AGU47489.1 putative glutathione-dependent formaldehyde-activating enzyme [Variovorax paradoxus B4]